MGAGAVLSRPACKPNPPTRIRTSDSDFGSRTSDLGLRPPTRSSDADFRLGPAKRILTSDFGLRHSVSVFGWPVREGTRLRRPAPPRRGAASFLVLDHAVAEPRGSRPPRSHPVGTSQDASRVLAVRLHRTLGAAWTGVDWRSPARTGAFRRRTSARSRFCHNVRGGESGWSRK